MIKKLCFLIILSFSIRAAYAKDFGVRGPVYAIAEKNLLKLIQSRLIAMQQNGTFADMQQIIQDKAKTGIQRPAPVKGIRHATENRAWTVDPTWILSQSIYDHKGQLIAKEGQRLNPLDFIPMPETLLFIDADNKAEIKYTQQLLTDKNNIKVILVNGNVVDLVENFNRPVYFDWQGLITSRFGILHTPAIVKQNGRMLSVNEVAL
ncbi:MAG: type-F conjugative transfer system protein TraW [Candidatus Berkiella sp.]